MNYMRNALFVKIPIQMNLSGNYPNTRDHFLTSFKVKKSPRIYDRGEQ